MEVVFFDFFGVCLAKVLFFSIILDFAVGLILDSDCVFKVLSFFTSSGSLDLFVVDFLKIDLKIEEGKTVSLKPKNLNQDTKRLWGMNRSLLNNAIIGASSGYFKTLELAGVGFRASIKGKILNMQLGFSHDINFEIPDTVKIVVEKQTIIKISGSDKQEVGMIASKIKSFRPPEPYKGKGIKEQGQYVLKKEGKKK